MEKPTKKKKIVTGNAILNRLYTAARDYVEEHEGSVVVIGGVALVDEGNNKFGIMVRCLGKKPNFPKKLTN
jgi:hypothetical protein